MNWRPETIEEHILALERELEEVNSSDEWEFINNKLENLELKLLHSCVDYMEIAYWQLNPRSLRSLRANAHTNLTLTN